MAEEVKKEATTEVKVDSPETKTGATAEVTTKTEEKEETSKAAEETTEGAEKIIDTDAIEVGKDGTLMLKVDKDDPKSTYYIGKDLNELIGNIRKGIKEKESFIRKLKTESKTRGTDVKKYARPQDSAEGDDADLPVPPDRNAIFLEHFKRAGINPQMATWSNQQWKDYGAEKGLADWEITEARNSFKEAISQAQTEYDVRNVEFINHNILNSEIVGIAELLEEAEVDVDEFDLEGVLDKVREDAKNFHAGGVFKSGRITKEAVKAINKMSKAQTKTKLTEEIEKKIAEGKEVKEKVKSSSVASAHENKTTKKVSNYEDALAQSLREYEASVKKSTATTI